ncbi:MAG: pyridoxamine 5'-phosphate oxidase family protein [Ruminococcus sp.]|nr:pyridoxamine 5'-phosphate oxidase family protein [Ruminococcus sp.]
MRRKDREITDKNAIENFIAQEQILRIGFYDDGDIYIVPVNYGYSYNNGFYSFYFHGAKAGRKYELAKKHPVVGFEIDGKYQLLEGNAACDYSAFFQSVIGNGKLFLVEDINEKITALNTIMRQTTKKEAWDYDRHMLETVAIFRIDVMNMSCKAR